MLLVMRAAIIGCGQIGQKRARALAGCSLVVCCDRVGERAEALARTAHGAAALTDWRAAVTRPDVDVVLVATTHDMLAPIVGRDKLMGGAAYIGVAIARPSACLRKIA